MAIPMRTLGKTGAKVSAIGLGGHHLGDVPDVKTAKAIVHEAIEGGITFFDNCWEYHNGRSEEWMGQALEGKRSSVFLMTKVCTHGRDGSLATKMLEESLRRLRTDHLDLWQIHGVAYDDDPERAHRKGGVVEALEKAKKEGKVRFVGFTGHKDPSIHTKMLSYGFAWDTVQFPLNVFDAHFRSFQEQVLPLANSKGIACLGMKPMNGKAEPIKKGIVSAKEALRYAMSFPVATTICGIDSPEVLRQNLEVARSFVPMTTAEMDALRARVKASATDGRFEMYKVGLKYDNPEARLAHDFPLDDKQKEVQESLSQSKK